MKNLHICPRKKLRKPKLSVYGVSIAIMICAILFISCPKVASEDDDNNNDPPATTPVSFSFTDEYPRFHTYYAKVTMTSGPAIQATMLVSTSSSPPALSSVSSDAYYTRKFDSASITLKTRPIYIGWNDQYTGAAAKARRATLTNAGLDITDTTVATTHYTATPWMLKDNTQYYLHIYYTESGVAKTKTRAFTTMTYPVAVAGIDSGLYTFDASLNIERKSTEPIFYTSYDNSHTNSATSSSEVDSLSFCSSPSLTNPSNPIICRINPLITGSDLMVFLFRNHGFGAGSTGFLEMGVFQFYEASVIPTTITSFISEHGATQIATYNVTSVTE